MVTKEKSFIKRSEKKVVGVFIDGVALDRATKRLHRRIDFKKLVRGVTSGLDPIVVRYYTIIPHEDDARQLSFLDAIHRAGMEVIIKRLPPKNVTRQVTIEIEMAADIVAFAGGKDSFESVTQYLPDDWVRRPGPYPSEESSSSEGKAGPACEAPSDSDEGPAKRIVTVICPSRDISYAIGLAGDIGADTVSADFSHNANVLKAAAKWIDLSSSETIWKE